jgi:hypothetical protein
MPPLPPSASMACSGTALPFYLTEWEYETHLSPFKKYFTSIAQAVSRWLHNPEARVCAWVSPCAIVDEVALGQGSLEVLPFYPVSIIPSWLTLLNYLPGDEQ